MGTQYKSHYCDQCAEECEITSAMDSALQQSLYVMENTAKMLGVLIDDTNINWALVPGLQGLVNGNKLALLRGVSFAVRALKEAGITYDSDVLPSV